MADNELNTNVQSITGRSRDECMDKLYDKYGTNFQVLGCKTRLSAGFLGFFQREQIVLRYQVTNSSLEQSAFTRKVNYPASSGHTRVSSTGGLPLQNSSPIIHSHQDSFLQKRDEFLTKVNPTVTNNLQIGQLTKQFDQFKNEMQEQMKTIVQATSAEKEHSSILKIQELLEENEFTKSYIKKMCSRMKNEFSLEELDDFDYVQTCVADWIGENIPIAFEEKKSAPKVIIIVGPTGVGKTTTVAKMSSMRVAAIEQLKRWAEIINVNVDKAESSEDLKILCDSYVSNSDYIFIDTSGYSPNDYENIAKMRTILNVKNLNENVYLAITAGVSAKDLENIIRNYEGFDFKSIIVTKCDETTSFGRVISVLSEKNKPVSWITTGQDVLNTIQRADPKWFLKNLSGFKINAEHIEKKFGTADKETE
ncbi:hypothetical protein [Treponema sp.]|uniref:hypothetical protein n=1 Tax=Treponema sp. TaxID=166 RepID=UPI00257F5C25|nr:hypothetical protein [Treponema sp.]